MFFVLSKTLDVLASPLIWAIGLAALGIWANRARRPSLTLAGPWVAITVLCVFAVDPVANALVRSLEGSAVNTLKPDVTYDAVVVLGGLVDERVDESSGTTNYGDGVERILAAYDLLRTGHARCALLSGGRVTPKSGAEADALERQLVDWGIANERLVAERESRNTHENAIDTVRIVRENGWTRLLLVTSAYHMKRAAGCFRAAGLAFDTLPVDFRTYDMNRFSSSWLPRADALALSTMAIHEYIGRGVYSLLGYSATWP